uniref:Uncharacterized protein n=1 Tax=Panagrolaimus sp. PS1159 TaxID=55785 RepID=A0AC35F4A1_9BILA
MIENENEDVVMTQLSLSSEIIPRYGFYKHIAATSKYCLPFFLKNNLSAEDTLQFQKAESRTMLNSVVMLGTDGENDDKIPVVPVSINNITADHPQTIFLTMRMFPKGQQFNILSRLYLDSIADQITLYQQLNINSLAIDKSNIISYLSSMFLLLQNNPNFDQDFEVLFGCRELESFIRQTSLDTSKKWGFIHSRRLARVLFTICLFLS